MKLARNTLSELGKIVTGDTKISPYRSGPELVKLFNGVGANDHYHQGFPTRSTFAEDKLIALNGKPELRQLIDTVFDAREWIGKDCESVSAAVTHLNKFLKFDGYELTPDGEHFKARELGISLYPR